MQQVLDFLRLKMSHVQRRHNAASRGSLGRPDTAEGRQQERLCSRLYAGLALEAIINEVCTRLPSLLVTGWHPPGACCVRDAGSACTV